MISRNFCLKRAFALCLFLLTAVGLSGGSQGAELPLASRSWTVDGTQRTALIHLPPNALTRPSPVLFAFHGHGGSMGQAAWNFGYHRLWPEAIVVYMQGLPTPSKLVDPEGLKPGWQSHPGDQADRDLHFFDAVLASLRKEFKVDEHRIFATGHSNGGMFTYLLWASRGNELAAIAPSAAFAPPWAVRLETPKPVFHIAGRQDQLVRFAWQERTMNAIRLLNNCSSIGVPWAKSGTLECTLYSSQKGTPFISGIHSGDHKFPAEAPELIVKFFKARPMK